MTRLLNYLLLLILLGAHSNAAKSQECQDTPEGRICRVQQPIVAGAVVDDQTQKGLGLVTISTGCSGTLLNRYWVLTARHCATTNGRIDGPLASPERISVTATWAPPGHVGHASRIRDFTINTNTTPSSDIVLIYLGAADLGAVDSQRIYVISLDQGGGSVILSGRLRTTDTVTQYGRGFSTFASGVFGTPSAIPSGGEGAYRSAQFTPSNIGATGYTLTMNASNQVGHGGDSGGPTIVTVNGVGVGVAGVQSTCGASGYVTNTPVNQRSWTWATGISECHYVSTESFISEIVDAIKETPSKCLAKTIGCGVIEASRLIMFR